MSQRRLRRQFALEEGRPQGWVVHRSGQVGVGSDVRCVRTGGVGGRVVELGRWSVGCGSCACEMIFGGLVRSWMMIVVFSCLVCVGAICETGMKSFRSRRSGRGAVCGRISPGFGIGLSYERICPGFEVD